MSIDRSARLLALVEAFSPRRVAVVGDIVADEFLTGQISRVSREAPVLILRYDSTRVVPGGAGNAANNVAALGGRVDLFGLAGRDEAGQAAASGASARASGSAASSARPTTARRPRRASSPAASTRPSSRSSGSTASRQTPPPADVTAPFEAAVLAAVARADAVLLSDYGSGLVTPGAGRTDRRQAVGGEAPAPGPGPRRLALQPGRVSAASPPARRTSPRSSRCSASAIGDDLEALERAGRALLRRSADAGGARHARQPRHGAVRAGARRPCTSRSSAPTRSPTSPAPATP